MSRSTPTKTFSPKHKKANWTINCNGDRTCCYPFLRKTIISQHTWAHFSWGCCCQKQTRLHGKDLILSRCYTFIHFTGMKKWFKCFKTIACSIELLFYLGKSVWYFKNTLMCKWLIRLGHSLSNINRSEWYETEISFHQKCDYCAHKAQGMMTRLGFIAHPSITQAWIINCDDKNKSCPSCPASSLANYALRVHTLSSHENNKTW